MKNRKNLLNYFLITLIIFGMVFINVQKVKAAGEHEFSFVMYDCNQVDEDALTDTVDTAKNRVTTAATVTCLGPNGDGNMPELSVNDDVEPGKIIKVGVHYVPGTNTDVGMQVKFFYANTVLEPIYLSKYNRSTKTYSNTLAYDLGEDLVDLYEDWTITPSDTGEKINYMANDKNGSAGYELEDELDMVYFYFRVKDTVTGGSTFAFNFDTTYGTGTAMNNKSAIKTTDFTLNVYGAMSSDNTLGSLSVTNDTTTYALSPTFTAGSSQTQYSTVVPNQITTIDLNATVNDTATATLIGTGTKNLNIGDNNFDIKVTAQNGEIQTHQITVRRLNNDARLSSLSATNVNLGTFSDTKTTYTATVPYATSSTTVSADVYGVSCTECTATDNDGKATIESGTGSWNLTNSGTTINTKDVVVKAENCATKYASVPGNTCNSQTYTMNVTRIAASTIKTLSDLSVDGTTVTGFSPTTYTYDLGDVANSKTSINLAATVTDTGKATITTTLGNKTLSTVGDNTFTVTVQAEDGSTQDYTIKIHRLSNDSKLKSLSVTSDPAGTLSPGFSSSLLDYYTYTAPSTVDRVTIAAVVNDTGKASIISGTGEFDIDTNPTVNVTVQAEDGTQSIYIVKLVRAKSSNNNLSDLSVDGYTLSPTFNPATTLYTVNVDGTVTNVNISATVDDTGKASIISGTGNKDLNIGNNQVQVRVQAENGTIKDYTININRAKKTIAALTDLKVDGTTVTGFSETTLEYTLPAVAFEKTSVEIEATLKDSDSTVTGDGTVNLSTGDNALHVTVTAQDGTTQTQYTININRAKDYNNYLSDLKVDGTTITGFVKTTNDYNLIVENSVKSLTLTTPTESTAATVTVSGNSNFVTTATNVVTITVTAENGDINIYKINVTRKKSDNNYLKSIGLSDGLLNPVFNKDTVSYTVDVDRSVTTMTITPTLEDTAGSVNVSGPSSLVIGENTFTITATSESGIDKVYTVVVRRNPSSNNYLSNLTVDGTTVTGFVKTKTSYTVNVGSNTSSVTIAAAVDEEHATLTGEGTFTINTGVNNFDIVVTAEDTTPRTYTVVINRAQSNDSTLSNLSVLQTVLNETFSPSTLTYTANVAYTVTAVDIVATVNDSKASVTGDGAKSLNTGDNNFDIVVTAEDNTTTTYKLNVIRAKNTNANLNNISLSGGYTLSPSFDQDTTNYSVTVPNTVAQIQVTGYKQDPNAVSVTGDGTISLNTGNNDVVITVTAEDGKTKKVYTVKIYRELSDDATLKSLVPSSGTLNPTFASGTDSYELIVQNEVTSVTFTAQPTSDAATYSVSGNTGLTVGNNAATITVTAENGDVKLYNVTIKRQPSSNNFLSTLSVKDASNNEYIETFLKTKENYTITVENNINKVTIDGTLEDITSTVTGLGEKTLDIGENTYTVTVTSAASISRDYIIKITRKSNSNTYLSSLEVEGQTITPAFNKNTVSYSLNVPNAVDKIKINATPEVSTSTVTGTGEYSLITDVNNFNIDVTAEDLSTKTYVIVVTRAKSSNNNLGNLSVTPGDLTPAFNKDTTKYTVHVDNATTTMTISANVEDTTATITGDGIKSLNVGKQTFNVVVKAENNETKTYEIEVERDASSNNNLTDLTVDGTTVSGFNKSILEYTLNVANNVTSINVGATLEDVTATVGGLGDISLSTGLNTIEVPVTAENGDVQVYKLKVTRAKSSNNYLTNLTVQEGTLTPAFDKDTDSYSITVPYETTSLTINTTKEDETAVVEIDQNSNFSVGTNTVMVNVVAEDGSVKAYRLNVTRQPQANNFLTSIVVTGSDSVRYSLSPEFSKNVYSYTVELDKNVTSVNIAVEKEALSLIVTGDGNVPITSFPQTQEITVATTGGLSRKYTIKFTKGLSSNASLQSLSVDKGTLSPAYSKTEFAYNVDLPKGTTEITVSAVKDESVQSITGTGTISLTEGRNSIKVIVTAENGNTNTYTIFANVASTTDNVLKSLTVDKGVLSPAFDKDTNNYTVNFDTVENDITISATGDNTITGTGTFTLVNGANVFNIETEKNGEKNTYTIIVNNGSIVSNDLASLSVDNYSLKEPFNKNTTTYNLPIDSIVDKITVHATPENPNATVTVSGNENLQPGLNTVTVTVSDPTLGDKVYTINVVNGQTKIISSIHTVESTYIKTIRENKTSAQVKSEMTNPDIYLKIYNLSGNEISDTDIVGTGYEIRLIINGTQYDSKKLIVKGDLNSFGDVDVSDLIKLERYILKTGTLSAYELEAGDINDDGSDDVSDLLLIERHILQNYNIYTKEVR